MFEQIGNVIFFVAIALCVLRDRSSLAESPTHIFAAPLGFIGLTAAFGVVGALIGPASPVVAVTLLSFFGLGYYPGGPDMDLFYGATTWATSVIALMAAAMTAGALLRRSDGTDATNC